MASHANRDVEICQSKCHYLIVRLTVDATTGVFPPFFPGDLGLAFAGRGLFYDIPVRYFSMALGTDSLEMIPSGIPHWVPQPGNGVCLGPCEANKARQLRQDDFLLGPAHPIPTEPATTAQKPFRG